MFDFDEGTASHMPFAAPDPARHFEAREFCCIMVGGKWKIHQFSAGKWVRINTGLPEDATECSPAAECLFGVWYLTFIAGGAEEKRMFRLYHIADLDAGALPVEVCPADAGFLQKNRLVYGQRSGAFTIEDPHQIQTVTLKDAEYIYRIAYDPFDPHRLFISGKTFGGEIFSRILTPEKHLLQSLTADGGSAYKAANWRGEIYYAKRTGEGFEDRQIVRASEYRTHRLPFRDYVSVETQKNRGGTELEQEFE